MFVVHNFHEAELQIAMKLNGLQHYMSPFMITFMKIAFPTVYSGIYVPVMYAGYIGVSSRLYLCHH
jgi:hypothetical protein